MIFRKNLSKIPNLLTLSRIVLVFVLLSLGIYINVLYVENKNANLLKTLIIVILVIFVIAYITDWLDGYLARKYHVETTLGKFLDPIADKFLINITLILFATFNWISVLFPALIIFRDLIINALRFYLASKQKILPADKLGKIKTVILGVSIIVIFILEIVYFNQISLTPNYLDNTRDLVIFYFILLPALFLTYLSLINYFKKNKKIYL